jgi:O-antigen/teichoic acid export membrane protein
MTNNSPSVAKGEAFFVSVARPERAKPERPSEAIDPNEKHLRTDHLLADLKSRTVSGAFVTIITQGAQFILNLISIMVLARLLTPRDFGLYAMVTVMIGYLQVFKDAGLSTATVQREGITQAQVSNLFWINVGLSGAITLLLAACSPLVAWFYHESRLIGITLALSATFLLNGLAVQHAALLSRQMRFKARAVIQVSSTLIGVALAIGMALLGCKYWALVISNLVTILTMTLFTWLAIPWRPQAPSRGSGVRPLLSFGAKMASGGLMYQLARGADGLLIGRYYGAGPLGLYSRAVALVARPMQQFMSPINSVFLPALSRIQNQPKRYRRAFLQIYETMALASCFVIGLLFALARPVTLVVLGPKWEQTAIIFAAFAASTVFVPPATVSTWLFASQGRGKEWLISSLLGSAITVASFLIGLPFGPAGGAIAASIIGATIGIPALYYFAGRRGPVTTGDLWKGVLRYIPLWAVVCGSTYLARGFYPNAKPLMQLLICAPVGIIAGAILIWVLPPMRRVALGVLPILRELKFRRVLPNPD